MQDLHDLLQPDTYRFIDQSELGPTFSAMQSFATDDALSMSVGQGSSPTVARLWVHHNTVVLGIPDAKLPHIDEGLQYLNDQGFKAVVRNSGGLAVVLDQGVLNLSFVFPDSKDVDIHEGYDAMVQFIQRLFQEEGYPIEAFEITGSYCPGTYDLSINGKKFAGISQRRVKNGSAVQIYLCVEGSGSERAAMIEEFYERAIQGEETRFTYPVIKPETMASLSELFQKELTVQDVRNRILFLLNKLSNRIITDPLNDQEMGWFEKRFDQMIQRNEKAL